MPVLFSPGNLFGQRLCVSFEYVGDESDVNVQHEDNDGEEDNGWAPVPLLTPNNLLTNTFAGQFNLKTKQKGKS